MHIYLIEITKMQDGTIAKAIWEKTNIDDARMAFHQTLASAIANLNVEACLCMITDECGNEYKDLKEYWSREPQEEAE